MTWLNEISGIGESYADEIHILWRQTIKIIMAHLFTGLNCLHSHEIVHFHLTFETVLGFDRATKFRLIDSGRAQKLQREETNRERECIGTNFQATRDTYPYLAAQLIRTICFAHIRVHRSSGPEGGISNLALMFYHLSVGNLLFSVGDGDLSFDH
jgi:hypothetical protein